MHKQATLHVEFEFLWTRFTKAVRVNGACIGWFPARRNFARWFEVDGQLAGFGLGWAGHGIGVFWRDGETFC